MSKSLILLALISTTAAFAVEGAKTSQWECQKNGAKISVTGANAAQQKSSCLAQHGKWAEKVIKLDRKEIEKPATKPEIQPVAQPVAAPKPSSSSGW